LAQFKRQYHKKKKKEKGKGTVGVCRPSYSQAEAEDPKLEASLGNAARPPQPHLQEKKRGWPVYNSVMEQF
jgi:hypothetical protein